MDVYCAASQNSFIHSGTIHLGNFSLIIDAYLYLDYVNLSRTNTSGLLLIAPDITMLLLIRSCKPHVIFRQRYFSYLSFS